MKIIKDNYSSKAITCPNCCSILEYNKQDIKLVKIYTGLGWYKGYYCIKCPCCGKWIDIGYPNYKVIYFDQLEEKNYNELC